MKSALSLPRVSSLAIGLLLLLGPACQGRAQPTPQEARSLSLRLVTDALAAPVYLTAPPGDRRLFVVEQPGRIRILERGALLSRPFLDLTDRVRFGGERGLLSMAFHPRYRENGLFFVNYTDRNGDTRVERYRVGSDSNRADVASAALIIQIEQPYSNHNGGHILFGPDGMLYIGMGDGGSGGDPHGHGQNRATLLGDLLRLDVDRGDPYGVPRDNPFVGRTGMRPEIWAYGLRNPWRFCFDQGNLYIADVGQNAWEEIHVAKAATAGLNYGWNLMEGRHCYKNPRCDRSGLVEPLVEYGHGEGCSITGGFVYRGRAMPELVGHYFYSDYCRGWIRSFRLAGGAATDHRHWEGANAGNVTSFGMDGQGELYVMNGEGKLFRIEHRSPERRGR